jgi:hypothetical protein
MIKKLELHLYTMVYLIPHSRDVSERHSTRASDLALLIGRKKM